MRREQSRKSPPALDAEAWIAAAFDALAEGGIDAVRVEPLAKALDITKGSFYWHFADRRALLDAMLGAWAEGRIAAIREQATVRGAPAAVLRRPRRPLHPPRQSPRAHDRACDPLAGAHRRGRREGRAQRRPRAAAACRRAVRRARLAGRQAQARAILFYSYLFGQSLLDAKVVPAAARDKATVR